MLISEIKNELENHIIPFWDALRDDEFGGFYGQMDNDLNLDKKGGKGVILNSRILWFYSSCYRTVGGEKNLDNARLNLGTQILCLLNHSNHPFPQKSCLPPVYPQLTCKYPQELQILLLILSEYVFEDVILF